MTVVNMNYLIFSRHFLSDISSDMSYFGVINITVINMQRVIIHMFPDIKSHLHAWNKIVNNFLNTNRSFLRYDPLVVA